MIVVASDAAVIIAPAPSHKAERIVNERSADCQRPRVRAKRPRQASNGQAKSVRGTPRSGRVKRDAGFTMGLACPPRAVSSESPEAVRMCETRWWGTKGKWTNVRERSDGTKLEATPMSSVPGLARFPQWMGRSLDEYQKPTRRRRRGSPPQPYFNAAGFFEQLPATLNGRSYSPLVPALPLARR
jgi:hypothetical protein